jgi:hypothetical protein
MDLSASDLEIPLREVARLARCEPWRRWESSVKEAIDEAREILEPRARTLAVQQADLGRLFEKDTPVETIAHAGRCWLFIATIGPVLESRVSERMRNNELLESVLLDAAGSTAVEAVCDEVQKEIAAGEDSERFSPGYCSWSLEAQRGLFGLLHPLEIGVELLPSMLMQPLKSVSGMVVCAPKEQLEVPARICATCDAQGCARRKARFVRQ